jgi:glycosyltransferase involved in cell wall biosynthesis
MGIALDQFDPDTVTSHWGKRWEARKQAYLKATGKKFLLLCVSRLSPEKGIQELLQAMTIMDNCALWLVGDGPFRQDLEQQAEALGLPVKFWGYQSGDALHSVYSAGDCFVCPSLTETFGQTVNEALAMNMRVALPRVSVFTEAYGEFITGDAFWDPLNREGMAASIQTQLERHAKQSPVGRPDRSKLKTWEAACESLLVEYHKAALDAQAQYDQRRVQKKVLCILPFWVLLTAIISVAVLLFSKIVLLVDSIPKFAQQHLPNSLEMKIHKA